MVNALVILIALLASASSARADYNRQVGPAGLPEATYVPGQFMRATDADNAKLVGGTNHTVPVGQGVSSAYNDATLETCNPFASPPQFLWYNATTHDFECVNYGLAAGPVGAVQRSNGSGTLVGDAHLSFDTTDDTLTIGEAGTNPGKIAFTMSGSTPSTAFGQVQGRGGGHYIRFYPDRRIATSSESFYLGLDSQVNGLTDAFFITRENPDPFLGALVFRFGEDHTQRFYSAVGDGTFTSLQAKPSGSAGNQTWTLPSTTPTNGYCIKTNGTGEWFFDPCGAGVTDHGGLTGLLDDDHTQYAYLAGRAGGQTLLGGTVAAQNIVLGSNSASSLTGYVGTISPMRLFAAGLSTASSINAIEWSSTWSLTSNVAFPRVAYAQGTFDYQQMPLLGLGPGFFLFQGRLAYDATGSIFGAGIYYNGMTHDAKTGRTVTMNYENASAHLASFIDRPSFTRTGTGTYDASANYVGFKSWGEVLTGVTLDRATGIVLEDWGGAGTLNKQRGLVVDNKTKCTAPNCVGISNASTTDYPGATQNLNASGAITGCTTRTSAYITQGSAGATLRINAAPTLADGRDGQTCRITNVDTAGNTAFSVEDETVTAGTNLRVSVAASCNLCALGTCTLNTRDYVEFTYNGVLGDWIMTGCANN